MKRKTCRNSLALAILTISLGCAGPVSAKVFLVAEGENIQDAIDAAAAAPGADTVLLAPGTYNEFFEIEDPDPLTLRGTGEVTIVGGNEDEDVIKVEGGQVRIQNIGITGGDDGIDASGNDDGGSLIVVGVRIWDNADEGLETGDMDSISVYNSSFTGNGGDGMSAEEVQRVVVVNVVSNGNDDGYDFEGVGSATMFDVVCDSNDNEGLEVDDTGSVNVVRGTFNFNADEGIDLDDTVEISLLAVEAIGNGGSGFQSEAEGIDVQQITVSGSQFAGNGEDGIQFREDAATIAAATLSGVVCSDNLDSGLDLELSGSLGRQGVSSGTEEGNGAPDVLP